MCANPNLMLFVFANLIILSESILAYHFTIKLYKTYRLIHANASGNNQQPLNQIHSRTYRMLLENRRLIFSVYSLHM